MRRILLTIGACWGVAALLLADGAVPAAPDYNEFQGSVVTVDSENHRLQMAVDGGYSVEFAYDSHTVVKEGSSALKPAELGYGDKITVRYQGKELLAKEILRTAQAPALRAVPIEAPTPVEPVTEISASSMTSIVSSVTVSTPTP